MLNKSYRNSRMDLDFKQGCDRAIALNFMEKHPVRENYRNTFLIFPLERL